MFTGAFLVPLLVCGMAFLINFLAIYYHSSRAIPFGTMVSVVTNAPIIIVILITVVYLYKVITTTTQW